MFVPALAYLPSGALCFRCAGARHTFHAVFDRDPPFTTKQLAALVIPETFEVIDWPGIFGVTPTPLPQALAVTFRDPHYSKVVLDF